MKKIIAFLLIIVYAAASSGATLHFHLCMGKLQGVGLAAEKNINCENCGMAKGGNNCCTDIQKTLKTVKDYSVGSLHFNFPPLFAAPVSPAFVFVPVTIDPADRLILSATGPPGVLPTPLFLRYCKFRI